VELANQSVGRRRTDPSALAIEEGDAAQHDPLDSTGNKGVEADGHPASERVPDHNDPVGQRPRCVEQGEQLPGVLVGPPGFRWRRSGPESEQIWTEDTYL
jgi:hypothetical protein